ncbi:MAG: FAD binding domain-containing protein [Pseudobdellovibrio sp.]
MEKTLQRSSIVFYLNGRRIEVTGQDTLKPFAYYLRYVLDMPGTKIVCSEGDCGACTLLIAPYRKNELQKFMAINSCITPVFSLDLSYVVTVEGLAESEELSTVQKCFIENNGAQCGYCTPGFVCAMTALTEDCLLEKKQITEKKARNYLTGNLCRCTGYAPIIKAAIAIDLTAVKGLNRYVSPESLVEFKSLASSVHIRNTIAESNFELCLPKTLVDAVKLKTTDMRLVAGATDLGVLINKNKLNFLKVMSLIHVDELNSIENKNGRIKIGARVTLAELEETLKKNSEEFSEIFKIFASPQIKNTATLIGNIVNASPIADSIPALMVLNTMIFTLSSKGSRCIAMTDFYMGYKQLDLLPNEIVTHIEFELPAADEIFKLYKVSPRKDLDISVVTFAGVFKLKNKTIETARIAYGGVGPVVIRMKQLESKFVGNDFSENLFLKLSHEVEKEISPLSDLRGSREFRLKLSENLLKKCYHEISQELSL